MRNRLKPVYFLAFFLAACSLLAWAAAPSTSETPADSWPCYGQDAGGIRSSRLTQITRQNAPQLKVAWTFHTGDVSEGGGGRNAAALGPISERPVKPAYATVPDTIPAGITCPPRLPSSTISPSWALPSTTTIASTWRAASCAPTTPARALSAGAGTLCPRIPPLEP